jgi:ABC-type nitrate/sulfonate/bicarbonate transport system substrate-binding protein
MSQRLFPSGADAMLAFRGIGAQFVAAGDIPSILLWSEDTDSVGIAPIFASTENLFGVVSGTIKGPEDLKGKKIATKINSTSEYFIDTYLRKNGLNPSQVHVIDLSPPEMVPALVAGEIDGFFVWRPYPALAEKIMGDKVRVLTSAKGYYVERLLLNANRTFAKQNPEVVLKVLRAIQKAIDYSNQNPDEASALMARKIKTDPSVVKDVLKLNPFNLTYDVGAANDLAGLSQFLVDRGRLKKSVDLTNAFDPSYLRAVNSKLAP